MKKNSIIGGYMITIGITAAGSGIRISILNALRYSRRRFRIIGLDMSENSPAPYRTDAFYKIPPVEDSAKFIDRLLEIFKKESIDLLIPGLDMHLLPLAEQRELFAAAGHRVICGSPAAIALCRDKYACFQFCREKDLPFVKTWLPEEARQIAQTLDFPLILKPRDGSGSAGVRLIHSVTDLLAFSNSDTDIVQEYLPPPGIGKKAQSGKTPPQTDEISIQYYLDKAGEVPANFPSINRLKAGVPIEIKPLQDAAAINAGMAIAATLVARGLRGPVNLQGRTTTEGIRFFEINPRFTGITGLRAQFGYHEVAAAIEDFHNSATKDLSEYFAIKSYCPSSTASIGYRYVEDGIFPLKKTGPNSPENHPAGVQGSEMPRRVLVTGASGYLGAGIIAALLKKPEIDMVYAAVRSAKSALKVEHYFTEHFANQSKLKIRFGDLAGKLWSLDSVDAVIHTAAARPPTADNPDSYFSINCEGTRRLISAINASSVKHLIYISSQSVYGTRRPPLWHESDAVAPQTPYALSKYIGEELCRHNTRADLLVRILRVARIYGCGRGLRWNELPHQLAASAVEKGIIDIYGSGFGETDLLHIDDLAAAVLATLERSQTAGRQIFNIGQGQPLTVNQLAQLCHQAVLQQTGRGIIIQHTKPNREQSRVWGMSNQRARRHLGWQPAIAMEAGLSALVQAAIECKTVSAPGYTRHIVKAEMK